MPRFSQAAVEAIIDEPEAHARVSQYVVEAIIDTYTRSPTTVTGAGVTQYVVEAIIDEPEAHARVSQYVVEAIIEDTTVPESAPAAVTRAYGYAT